jgi:hypothetical protein
VTVKPFFDDLNNNDTLVTIAPIDRKYGDVRGVKPKRPSTGMKVIAIPAMTTNMLLMTRSRLG